MENKDTKIEQITQALQSLELLTKDLQSTLGDEKLFDMIMEPQIRRAEKLKEYLTSILDGLKNGVKK
jgi:hypothetical protein